MLLLQDYRVSGSAARPVQDGSRAGNDIHRGYQRSVAFHARAAGMPPDECHSAHGKVASSLQSHVMTRLSVAIIRFQSMLKIRTCQNLALQAAEVRAGW